MGKGEDRKKLHTQLKKRTIEGGRADAGSPEGAVNEVGCTESPSLGLPQLSWGGRLVSRQCTKRGIGPRRTPRALRPSSENFQFLEMRTWTTQFRRHLNPL